MSQGPNNRYSVNIATWPLTYHMVPARNHIRSRRQCIATRHSATGHSATGRIATGRNATERTAPALRGTAPRLCREGTVSRGHSATEHSATGRAKHSKRYELNINWECPNVKCLCWERLQDKYQLYQIIQIYRLFHNKLIHKIQYYPILPGL